MAGIYLHVPFCHSKCAYCDFYSRAGSGLADAYISAVADEYASRRGELDGQTVRTLYFGGGTPSILSAGQIKRLTSVFKDCSPEEFTIEANPEDIDSDRLEVWADYGINRVSMGVQSLVDSELKAVGRRHSAAQALSAIDDIRRAGFDNLSCDLIYGLPGQTEKSWRYSVDTLLALRPEHLSAYCLTIEPRTVLGKRLNKGEITEANDETVASYYNYLCRATAEAGYRHYEISNFSLPQRHSRHNSSYWDSTPYLGLGPGAHSLGADGMRRYVESNIRKYIANPADCLHEDPETEIEKINDIIFTALRTDRGLDLKKISSSYHPTLLRNAGPLIADKLISLIDTKLIIAEKHWLISDTIIRTLLLD